jgi:hypothetical protein
LATQPWLRAQALEELAHGQLLKGEPAEAIATLRHAFEAVSDPPMAGVYARIAFQRLKPSSGDAAGGSSVSDSLDSLGPGTAMGGPGMSFARPARRSTRASAMLREADQLVRDLETPGTRARAASTDRRQEALNRLDELFPGCATDYAARTGDVVDVDLSRVRESMNRLAQPEDDGAYMPGPGTPVPPGPGGPPVPSFRP